jgi:YihY family inner membrane protein
MDPKHWRHHRLRSLVSFWIKISNDWIFNLAGVLAYNLLLSVFPILLLLLAITSFALDGLSPGSQMRLQHILQQALPEGTATNLLYHVTVTLHHSAPLLLVIGLVFALINGSNLFVVLENCLGIIFKLRGRNPIRQRLIAFAMLLLYVVVIPIMVLSSIVPAALVRFLGIAAKNQTAALFVQAAGVGLSVVSALLLFGVLYLIVPNRRVGPGEIWKGTVVATLLLGSTAADDKNQSTGVRRLFANTLQEARTAAKWWLQLRRRRSLKSGGADSDEVPVALTIPPKIKGSTRPGPKDSARQSHE